MEVPYRTCRLFSKHQRIADGQLWPIDDEGSGLKSPSNSSASVFRLSGSASAAIRRISSRIRGSSPDTSPCFPSLGLIAECLGHFMNNVCTCDSFQLDMHRGVRTDSVYFGEERGQAHETIPRHRRLSDERVRVRFWAHLVMYTYHATAMTADKTRIAPMNSHVRSVTRSARFRMTSPAIGCDRDASFPVYAHPPVPFAASGLVARRLLRPRTMDRAESRIFHHSRRSEECPSP